MVESRDKLVQDKMDLDRQTGTFLLHKKLAKMSEIIGKNLRKKFDPSLCKN
jgi:hypothetical protein